MRILVATTHRGVQGGAEQYLRALLPALAAAGHGVAILYDVPAQAGRPAIDDACPDVPTWRYGAGEGVAAAAAWRPDVCYLHGMLTPQPEVELAGRFRTVLFAHNFYATCASGLKCTGRPASPCGRVFGAACLPLNYVRGCGVRNPVVLVRQFAQQKRRLGVLRRVAAVCVASHYMAAEYARHGVPQDRIHFVPLFPVGQPDPCPPVRRPQTGRILFAGRFTWVKGGDLLIRAAGIAGARLGRELTLVFAGDGPERAAWERLAGALRVRAKFVGWCPAERLAELRRDADLLAVPSVWPEPFGLVGVEAGRDGLPAVGFAVGGIPEWLIAGESGESAPSPPTADGLADAIARALADPDHHHRLRVGAWRVAAAFTHERHLAALMPILAGAARQGQAAGITEPLEKST